MDLLAQEILASFLERFLLVMGCIIVAFTLLHALHPGVALTILVPITHRRWHSCLVVELLRKVQCAKILVPTFTTVTLIVTYIVLY